VKERRFNQWALRPIPTIETGGGQLPGPSPPILRRFYEIKF
jgi:hypothetical protein